MMLANKVDDLELEDNVSDMIFFENTYQNYFVGVVDVVNSTRNISQLSRDNASTYYSVFLNTVGCVIQNNGGKIVKNIGDGILFYFPKYTTINAENSYVPLDCGTKILGSRKIINDIFKKRKIPSIHYRISMDYGPLMIATSTVSSCRDIFGPTVNLCSKINHIAKPDQLVVGSDLFQIVKESKKYIFDEVSEFQSALKQNYPVYSVDT